MKIQESLKSWKTREILEEINRIAAQAPGSATNAPVAPTESIVDHPDPRAKALLNVSIGDGINCSVKAAYWDWDGEPTESRYYGTIRRCTNKSSLKPAIHWAGNDRCSTERLGDAGDGTTFLLRGDLDFRLEPYPDGRPAPKAPEAVANPFLLASTNFKDPQVLIARADTMVAVMASYFEAKVMVDRAAQVERMRVAQVFPPIYAMAQPVTEEDVDSLK